MKDVDNLYVVQCTGERIRIPLSHWSEMQFVKTFIFLCCLSNESLSESSEELINLGKSWELMGM